jgi:phosphoenolpyruvate carboxylase
MVKQASATDEQAGVDKDAPLKEDIRLLGRLLGDVLREQEGEEVFAVVETIRQTAVRFRREADAGAGERTGRLLKILTREQTISVVRAFSYFSHLANIAEDQHHIRRRRAHFLAGSDPQRGSVRFALDKLKAAGVDKSTVDGFFADALIAPVLTAHPTEVQRKSILDAERDIARLLAERDMPLTPREQAQNLHMLRVRVTTLWQTRMLRYTKLTVADEIENALSYYRITFLKRSAGPVRRYRGRYRHPVRPRYAAADQCALPADGQLDRRRPRRQSERQRRHHEACAGAPGHHHRSTSTSKKRTHWAPNCRSPR